MVDAHAGYTLAIARSDEGQEGAESARPFESNLLVVEVLDRFSVNLLASSEQIWRELGVRHGLAVALVGAFAAREPGTVLFAVEEVYVA